MIYINSIELNMNIQELIIVIVYLVLKGILFTLRTANRMNPKICNPKFSLFPWSCNHLKRNR